MSEAGLLLIGEPAEQKIDPRNVVDGQFSGPFVVAAALATGAMDWDSYNLLGDAAVRDLMARVSCEKDPAVQAEFPNHMSGRLRVWARGRVFEKTVVVPRGEPSNFPDGAALRAKFASLAEPVLGPAGCAKLAAVVLDLPNLPRASTVLEAAEFDRRSARPAVRLTA